MNPTEAKKELDAFLKTHEDLKTVADNLLSRVRNIKKKCDRKDFAGALSILDSRFWTYRYLRTLIQKYKELDASWRKLGQANTFHPTNHHRYLWYDEHMAELSRDKEKIKLFGTDVLKELSRGQSVEQNLRTLKREYNPLVAGQLQHAIEKIQNELINLDNFAQSAITILKTEEKEVLRRAAQVIAQSQQLERTLAKDLEMKIRKVLTAYSAGKFHKWELVDWSQSVINGRMITPSQLMMIVRVYFEVGSGLEGQFIVRASHQEPGTFIVSMYSFGSESEKKQTVDTFDKLNILADKFVTELKPALTAHGKLMGEKSRWMHNT